MATRATRGLSMHGTVGTGCRPDEDLYARQVALVRRKQLGFDNVGTMWRSGTTARICSGVNRSWEQLRPLYEALHCHVRAKLGEFYGTDLVPQAGLIPAHLLGNMWAQSWENIYDLVGPENAGAGYDLSAILQERKYDAVSMVKTGEAFFTSLGFEPLPETFWERSLFVQPADRDVVCHASAWNIDEKDDLRIKMCIKVNEEDFRTIHHELGHNYYQRLQAGLTSTVRAPMTASMKPSVTRCRYQLRHAISCKSGCLTRNRTLRGM
jgi:peptidyl-dipeptidase A